MIRYDDVDGIRRLAREKVAEAAALFERADAMDRAPYGVCPDCGWELQSPDSVPCSEVFGPA